MMDTAAGTVRPGPGVDIPQTGAKTFVVRRFLRPTAIIWTIATLLIATLVLMPLIRMLEQAFADGASGFQDFFALSDLPAIVGTTLVLGVGSTLVALVFGVGLAWCVQNSPPRIAGFVSLIPLLPLVIPSVASVIGWTMLASPRVGYLNEFLRQLPWWSGLDEGPLQVYSMPWIIVLTGLNLTSFIYLFVGAALRDFDGDLTAAANVAGAGGVRRFLTVTLPLLRPALVYGTGVVLLLALGQFTVPLLLGSASGVTVLTTEIFEQSATYPINYGLGAALSTPLILAGVLVILVQRRLLRAEGSYVTRSGRAGHASKKPRWWYAIIVLIFGLITVVLPLLAIIYVAFTPYWSGQLTFDDLTLKNIQDVLFNNFNSRLAVQTSIATALITIAIVLPIGFLCALAISGRVQVHRSIRQALDVLVAVPLGMPAAIFGFAILFAYTTPPFNLYGTPAIFVVAYVTMMLPFATRFQLSTLMQLSPDFWNASRVHGAGPVGTFFRVALPLCRTSIASGAAVVLILVFHEFTVSIMVQTPGVQVMGTALYGYWTGGSYSNVAAMALVMVVVTTVGVAMALLIGGRRALENI